MSAPENGNGDGSPPAFKRALRELAAALYAKKVEPICTAYLALRRASRGLVVRELLARITAAGGASAVPMIVSAFAHRKCFMCEDGTTACQTCDGTGMVDRFPCPRGGLKVVTPHGVRVGPHSSTPMQLAAWESLPAVGAI
jgi:hypothetical protein